MTRPGSVRNEEVRFADDLAFLAVEVDDGGEAPLVDGGGSLGEEAERFPFSLASIFDRREVRDVGRGGQGSEVLGLVLLSQPSERLLERSRAGFFDAVSAKVDAKPAPGGPVVVEDVRRDEANQFSGNPNSSNSASSANLKRNRADKHAAWQKSVKIWPAFSPLVTREVSTVTWQGSRSDPKIGSWQSRQVVMAVRVGTRETLR